jgi:hypothetical protein
VNDVKAMFLVDLLMQGPEFDGIGVTDPGCSRAFS